MQPDNENEADLWNKAQQEEFKGGDMMGDVPMAATLDKIFVPTIFGDDNLEFVVANP